MIASRVVRTGAVIGVIGGGLRAAGSFASRLIVSDAMRTWLYVATDIGLTVGLLSIYIARRHGMRAAGTIGSFLALGGLIAGRISPAVTDLDLYPVTAGAVVIGILVLAFSEWRMGRNDGMDPADVRAVSGVRQHRNIRCRSGCALHHVRHLVWQRLLRHGDHGLLIEGISSRSQQQCDDLVARAASIPNCVPREPSSTPPATDTRWSEVLDRQSISRRCQPTPRSRRT